MVLCAASEAPCLYHHCPSASTDTSRPLGNSEPANCRAVVSEQACCSCTSLHASASHTPSLVKYASSALQALCKWTTARSVPHIQSPPGQHVQLLGRDLINSIQEELLRTSSATELSARRSACLGCAPLRCCLPLSDHRLQLLHALHQFCQLFLQVPRRRQGVRLPTR